MDPISAAGIGLSVTSLCLQVFAGCIRGYELLSEAANMPTKYASLRTRLRLEQSRLLSWGEQIGLLEDLLDESSHNLLLHHNLIMEVLLEVHSAFRSCLKIATKFDSLTALDEKSYLGTSSKQSAFLQRARRIWQEASRTGARLEWAMIRQDSFEGLIGRLAIYNDRVESFLDRSTLKELYKMQEKSNLILLQLTGQVAQLQILAESFQIKSETQLHNTLSRSSTLVASETASEASLFSGLASFKAQNLSIDEDRNATQMLLDPATLKISLKKPGDARLISHSRDKTIWIEWRSILDERQDSRHHELVTQRLSKLAYLLNAPRKPEGFRSPQCLGYCHHQTEDGSQYGLVYEAQAGLSPSTTFIRTLRQNFDKFRMPSLSKRIELASKLAESLMYLHSVDWLHKGFQSDNILFIGPEEDHQKLLSPTISGFDFSRPDLSDEMTVKSISRAQDDYYRHPDLLAGSRSSKIHDIYALGVVLVEIALWRAVDSIIEVCTAKKMSRSQIPHIRERLLSGQYSQFESVLSAVSAHTGDNYASATRRCLEGGIALGIEAGSSQGDAKVGSKLQEVFYDEVYLKLKSMTL